MTFRRAAALCAAALAACKGAPEPPAAPPASQTTAPAQAPVGQRSDLACAAPLDATTAREKVRAPSGQLKLGVVAGLKDASDENVAHLRSLLGLVRDKGAEAIVALGDVGDNLDEQAVLLGLLAELKVPVLVVAGNREVRSELDAAEADLRKRGTRIVDLSHTRTVDLGDALVVGLAGTMDRRLVHQDGACVYVQKDIDALATFLDRHGGAPVILAMAVPPRGADANALDVSEGQNMGDRRIVPLLTPRRAPFGIFGQVWESGGRAIDGSGVPVPPGHPSEQLYVNVGAADRSAWPMADGSVVRGQAALLSLQGRRASVEMVRLDSAESTR
ncbi:MAG TPA: hypothetical protein VFE76_14710 [Myxococcales bacterium]|nr:hypothetical protein [Myxococcales bacterium]